MSIASLDTIAQRAASDIHTIRATFEACMGAAWNDVEGDFVECGVFLGANAAAMARAADDFDGVRVHLFDSFEGIPLAGEHDIEYRAAGHKAGLSCATEAQVRQHMKEWNVPDELLVYHPGWFKDTVPAFAATKPKIAVLRLDGDLYESTKVCIEQLFPLVSPGGWIIVDDWDLSGARKAVIETVGSGFGPIYFQRHA